jgi:hypothetical protein
MWKLPHWYGSCLGWLLIAIPIALVFDASVPNSLHYYHTAAFILFASFLHINAIALLDGLETKLGAKISANQTIKPMTKSSNKADKKGSARLSEQNNNNLVFYTNFVA